MGVRHSVLGMLGMVTGAMLFSGSPLFAQSDLSTVEGRFAHVTSKLDAGGVYYFYADYDGLADQYYEAAQGLFETLLESNPDPDAREGLEILAARGGPLYRYLGLSALRGFGSSAVAEGDGFLTRTFLSLDRGKLGDRPQILGGEPRVRRGVHLAPERAQVFVSADLSMEAAIEFLYGIAEIMDPDTGASQIDDGFMMAQAFTTVPWKEALRSLDGEMVIAAWADLDDWRVAQGHNGSFEYPHVLFLAALESKDSTLIDALLNWAQMQNIEIQSTESAGVRISTLVPASIMQGPSMSVAWDETFTYFASEAASIAEAITRGQGASGGLAQSTEFRRAVEGFPQENNSVVFISGEVFALFKKVIERNADDEMAGRLIESFEGTGYPLMSSLASGMVHVNEPDGMLFLSRGPNSPRNTMGFYPFSSLSVLSAIVVPNFLTARESARVARHRGSQAGMRQACQENQMKLDGAFQQFRLEYRIDTVAEGIEKIGAPSQTAPVDGTWVGTLIGETCYIRFEPVCPAGGVYTFNDTDANPDLPPVSCSLNHRPNVDPQYWHVFPGQSFELP